MFDLKKVQQKDLELAKTFVTFCQQHDLLCYFCGGGCIGAIRHGGFIPWDDDLDFFMPREDYEKLKELWKNTDDNPYVLLFPSEQYQDRNIFMTLRDKNTTMIKPYQKDLDIPHGVAIDIFPLDHFPKSKFKRGVQIFWALLYQLYCAEIVPVNYGRFVNTLGEIMLKLPKKWRVNIWQFSEKRMIKNKKSGYVTELCAGPKYMFKKYDASFFETSIYREFEHEQMPIPIGYDGYLKEAFGNYMEMPPIEQRVTTHEAILIDLENSYTKYKGTIYCVKEEKK